MVVNLFVIAACCSKNYHSLRFTSGAALLCLVPFVLALWRNTLRPDRRQFALRERCSGPERKASDV